jgi:CubicO group peptidase (beta-lactamase class C family)
LYPKRLIERPNLLAGTCLTYDALEFFQGITSKNALALTSTSNTPIYSNLAFQILGYALEAMTNKTFEQSLHSSLLEPLGLDRTSLEAPKNKSNAVIPGNETTSWWDLTLAGASP